MSILGLSTESGKSWKTSSMGIITMICGAAMIVGGFIVPVTAWISMPGGVGLMAVGRGLVFAKDKDVIGVQNAMNPTYEAVTPSKIK